MPPGSTFAILIAPRSHKRLAGKPLPLSGQLPASRRAPATDTAQHVPGIASTRVSSSVDIPAIFRGSNEQSATGDGELNTCVSEITEKSKGPRCLGLCSMQTCTLKMRRNGKEDTCVDVQHKKRGRPRLRDDRETRYEVSRGPASHHDAGLTGPTNAYAPGSSAVGPGYDIALHHAQQQRLAKPDPRESIPARYRPPLSLATQAEEPVAYLTLGLQFLRVSDPFREAMGGLGDRRSLHDVVMLGDRDRVLSLQGDLMAEQKQMEPNYLPPILDRGEQILGRHGFSARDVSAFNLNRQEYFGFVIGEGKWRQYPVRLGLGKEGSYFFVVMALAVMSSPHTLSPLERQPGLYGSSMPSQPPPGSMAHDLHRHRLSEGSTQPRPILSSAPQLLGGQSEGLSPIGYPLSTSRPEYTGPPSFRSSQNDNLYQLPPIRSQPTREDKTAWVPSRSGRVDIGGLIERPEGPSRP
ncbi:uncharacterized protein J7T54_006923 [Emericellopsis cladophorae]|uniref:Uncharacterized protein n=1 Tax=Emericellopsis cladophorae TaxID=2686198 RepID=A0A9P9Y8A5_9HYPO|nr:uncharacterized protein J7T54_006923 [Emericellopsis cladophorae]KAI6785281.1 hypothetical protein J7T54_006923 [Emericellopsis cladophorae]